MEFERMKRLPPYVLGVIDGLKIKARRDGEDIIDLGMGNPDLPTSQFVVDKLKEAADIPKNHRYSASRGIPNLRAAICEWYRKHFDVYLDPDKEAVVTVGSKEGLTHIALAVLSPGDAVLVPNPTYPIHYYSAVIAGADVRSIPLTGDRDFFEELQQAARLSWPKPKLLVISFPHNPTTMVVDLNFFHRIVDFARENEILVIHDLCYADLCFDGYRAPSILQVPGAKELAVEFFTLSKSYSMPGWRVGFCVGNPDMVNALTRIKSYIDYGVFAPIQIAAIKALKEGDEMVQGANEVYRQRRDVLVQGLGRVGWQIKPPLGTMFVWAEIPEPFRELKSVEFTKLLLKEAKVAVAPGVGFGEYGEGYVRFALVENEHRIRQAVRGIGRIMKNNVEG
ncbi:MAG: aminotransferase class I/II-fold pyridoxal phosphate-dependent enzyme [Proteobacteria bacterium]|nr:aminotransferase class I/II-fold pyridoxal phosphate-dependent enzyme [Pseudomonadota bacterium]